MCNVFTKEFKNISDLCFAIFMEKTSEIVFIGSKQMVWEYYYQGRRVISSDNGFPMMKKRTFGTFLTDFGIVCSTNERDGELWGEIIYNLSLALQKSARADFVADYDNTELEKEAAEGLEVFFSKGSPAHQYAAVFIWNEYLKALKYLKANREEILNGKAKIRKTYLTSDYAEQYDILDGEWRFGHNFRRYAERLIEPLVPGKAILTADSYSKIRNPSHPDDSEVTVYYPWGRKQEECAIITYSFAPLMNYYFHKMSEQGLKFQSECVVCHKPFLTDTLRKTICSESCRRIRQSENVADHRSREKERSYDRPLNNLRQRIYRLQKNEQFPEEVTQKLNEVTVEIHHLSKEKKELVKRGAIKEKEFTDWIQEQQNVIEDIVYPHIK